MNAKLSFHRPGVAIGVIAVVVPVILALVSFRAAQPSRVLTYATSERLLQASDLVTAADAIVVARFTGKTTFHWNNTSNTYWASDDPDALPMIYRDDEFDVVRVLRGVKVPNRLVVRGLGGEADGVTVKFEDQVTYEKDGLLLLVLSIEQTPTQTGSEIAWTVVANHQGAFRLVEARWQSDTGLQVDEVHLVK